MRTEQIENHEMNTSTTDLDVAIVTRDEILNKINTCLSQEPLNIGRDDYCYLRTVKNHLEIGRAKIILDE